MAELPEDPSEDVRRLNPHLYPNIEPFPLKIETSATLTSRPTTDEAKLNKNERDYLAWLRTMKDQWIGIQCLTFKLAHDCRYSPDFFALDRDGLRAVDCKGVRKDGNLLIWEDSLIKARVAARLYPWCRFIIAHKDGGIWIHEEIKP